MPKDFTIDQLKNKFKGRESFSRKELFEFYRQIEPDLKETTFRWRIYDLKAKKIITSASREFFFLWHTGLHFLSSQPLAQLVSGIRAVCQATNPPVGRELANTFEYLFREQ